MAELFCERARMKVFLAVQSGCALLSPTALRPSNEVACARLRWMNLSDLIFLVDHCDNGAEFYKVAFLRLNLV